MGELPKNKKLDFIDKELDIKDTNKKLDFIDNVRGPFYSNKIVESYEGGLLRKDTVMTTYYEINGSKISETEYQIYTKEGMQGVYRCRKEKLNKKEKGEKGNPEDILRKLD